MWAWISPDGKGVAAPPCNRYAADMTPEPSDGLSATDRARALGGRLGVPALDSLDDALAAADVVHICSPMASHFEIASRALTAGRSVVCEKPVAGTADEVRTLFAMAASNDAVLVPVHQFLFQRGVIDALAALPALGTLLHFDMTACTAGATGRDAAGAELVALDILPHPMSLAARFVAADLERVRWHVAPTPPGELRVTGISGAVSIGITISCAARPPLNSVRLLTTGGTMDIDLFHGYSTVDRGRATRLGKLGRPFTGASRTLAAAVANLARRAWRRESAYPGLRALMERSYESVHREQDGPITAAECIAVAEACEWVARARAAGRG